MAPRVIYSFIIDKHPNFSYQAWHLAKSVLYSCGARPEDIHLQLTPCVPAEIRQLFRAEGYVIEAIEPFGDGKWCNKIAQLPNLFDAPCDFIVLLDTDVIVLQDFRGYLRADAVHAKVVDKSNPRLPTLLALMAKAGRRDPPLTLTDAGAEPTVLGNANGGFYAVPRSLARRFHEAWESWALWLFAHGTLLAKEGKSKHIDQVSAAMAFQVSGVPYVAVPSNLNYFIHFQAKHGVDDESFPISVLHYHDTMDADGQIRPNFPLTAREADAVELANRLIRNHMHPALRWPGLEAPVGMSFGAAR
jgi:hypothetical protein